MIPIRTIETARPLRGLAKAYEDGVRDGRVEGFEMALAIVKDYLRGIEPIIKSWEKELGGKDELAKMPDM
jgi:hypothetical protein